MNTEALQNKNKKTFVSIKYKNLSVISKDNNHEILTDSTDLNDFFEVALKRFKVKSIQRTYLDWVNNPLTISTKTTSLSPAHCLILKQRWQSIQVYKPVQSQICIFNAQKQRNSARLPRFFFYDSEEKFFPFRVRQQRKSFPINQVQT